MKCKLEVICKFLESCNTEVCKHYRGEVHLAEPKKKERRGGARRKKQPSTKDLDSGNNADLVIARRILTYKNVKEELSEEHASLLKSLSGRHVKNFSKEEREALVNAAKNCAE